MAYTDDSSLLRQYAEEESEGAFAEIVSRYVNLVYSVALRSSGSAQAAQDISQAVFIVLARKARSLPSRTLLPGWLYQTTRLTAANYVRGEMRRQQREQEAFMRSNLNESEPDAWPHIAPILDDALSTLGEQDRNAILLRFFEKKNLRDVGAALGSSEMAAKMRVNRALEKLRHCFTKRGVTLSTAAIAGAVSANSVHGAPIGLANSISTVAAAKGMAASGSILTLVKGALKVMAWTQAKTAAVAGAVVLLAAGTTTLAIKEFRTQPRRDNSNDPVEMKIVWQVGKEYPMRIDVDQTSTTEVPGVREPVSQKVKLSQGFRISVLKETENGGRQLELQFESQALTVSQDDHNLVSFDSAQNAELDANNPAAPMLRAMLGARIQYLTDPNGKVESMDGVDELMKRMATAGKPQEQAMFSEIFNENTLRQYSSFADTLPDHRVKTGDHWQLKKDVPTVIGVLALDMNYNLKNWAQHRGSRCAHIEGEGTLSTKSTAPTTGMAIEVTKGNISGDFWYDPVLGMITDVNNDQDLALKITTRAQTMKSQFTRKVRLNLVDAQ